MRQSEGLQIPFPFFLFVYAFVYILCTVLELYHHLLYLFLLFFLLLYPYLHNAHVYVLTDQIAALSNHESGCCSRCVKNGGQQRKAICLLHPRAKPCCLKNTTGNITMKMKFFI